MLPCGGAVGEAAGSIGAELEQEESVSLVVLSETLHFRERGLGLLPGSSCQERTSCGEGGQERRSRWPSL